MTGRRSILPPLGIADEWLDRHDLTLRLSVETFERWCAAAERDGYGPNGENLSGWLRDLGDERCAII